VPTSDRVRCAAVGSLPLKNAMRMHYDAWVFKSVGDSERPYWAARGRDGTTLVCGRTYAGHDTSKEMEHGEWVEPQPMATTSLRLPIEVIGQLKRQAKARHLRYTTYVRLILEQAAVTGLQSELAEITERLDRIERAIVASQTQDDQKTA
jgi:hypothetical protein